MKFCVGDVISPAMDYHGFEDAKVIGILEIKGRMYYRLKIMNGTATIPVTAEDNYELLEK